MQSTGLTVDPVPLLKMKLYPPPVTSNLIPRPQLIHYLNQGLSHKLTLVAAPAGYGKTTIISQWLDHLRTKRRQTTMDAAKVSQTINLSSTIYHQIAWLSLDETDNNLILFVQYLVATIQQHQPGGCTTTLAALSNPQLPSWSQLAALLLNDLLSLTDPLILVLDDYHFIVEEEIHQFLDRLLDHLPPLLHLVLISRTEPPLSLPRLRVRQQMNELRTADLSFSDAETERYLTQDNTTSFTPAAITALQERSHGWIAGLYLAKLSLGHNRNEQALLKQLKASNSHIMDYLLTEVLAQQPQVFQTFLLHTSILRRFCRPLCEALLAGKTLATDDYLNDHRQLPISHIIDSLARHHLFTIPLDDSGDWYRYHHLFQLMLSRRLQKESGSSQVKRLHQKASHWFAQEGLIDEALHHAHAADDITFAVELVEQHRLNRLNQFDYHTLERWLALLPQTAVSQRPRLLLLQCWLAISTYRLTAVSVPQQTQQAENILKSTSLKAADRTILAAEIAAIRGVGYFWSYDFPQVIHSYRQSIDALPRDYFFVRSHITLATAISLQSTGQPAEAIRIMQAEIKDETTQSNLPSIWLRSYLAIIYFMNGRFQQVVHTAEKALALLNHYPLHKAYAASITYRWLGTVYYEWNHLETARRYFLQTDPSNSSPYYNSHLFLAWSYEMTGQPDKTMEIIKYLQRWAAPLKSDTITNSLTSFKARCLYWHGDIEAALHMLHGVTIPKIADNFLMEMPALTQIKILIAHDQASSWQKAAVLLTELWVNSAEKGRNIPAQVEILTLKALLLQRQGQLEAALTTLKQAIHIAKPNGFIRTFVDQGTPMASLLYQLLERGVEPDYIGQLLAAFPQTEPYKAPAQQEAQKQLIEPLTKREMDVLLLLAAELPNKKIAQQLSISPLTVKRHTINLYQKLSVSSRRNAVRTAKALGIL